MNQIRIAGLREWRRMKMRDGSFWASDFHSAHRSEPTAVVETGRTRELIERLGINRGSCLWDVTPAKGRASIGCRANAADRVDGQGLGRQPHTARELPVPLLRTDERACFAHAPLIKG